MGGALPLVSQKESALGLQLRLVVHASSACGGASRWVTLNGGWQSTYYNSISFDFAPQASFRQWQVERSVPKLEQEVAAASAARDAVVVQQEEQVRGLRLCKYDNL